jgi:hypothetical protein
MLLIGTAAVSFATHVAEKLREERLMTPRRRIALVLQPDDVMVHVSNCGCYPNTIAIHARIDDATNQSQKCHDISGANGTMQMERTRSGLVPVLSWP